MSAHGRNLVIFVGGLLSVALTPTAATAHCEVPCGIYGDKIRISVLHEHVATIAKAMAQITALSGLEDAQSQNQLVRWITTKEDHANQVQEIVTQYFMTQRVKPAEEEEGRARYVLQLTTLHAMLQSAMKCKQTVDAKHAAALREQTMRFALSYFSEEDYQHIAAEHGLDTGGHSHEGGEHSGHDHR